MLVKINCIARNLPDFLIVGAAKSGTTSLYHYLKQHPQIFMPENKEPWFFSLSGITTKSEEISNRKKGIVTDFNVYLDLFNDAKVPQILGEASTTYLYLYEETIKNIKKYHPNWNDLKIIIILRNPIERAYSHYLYDVSFGYNNPLFEEILEKWKLKGLHVFNNYIDYGLYFNQIKSYKNNFDKVKIYLFEDLERNSSLLVRDISDFLKIGTSFIANTTLKHNMYVGSNKLLGNFINKPNLIKELINLVLPNAVRIKMRNKMVEVFSQKPKLKNSWRKFLKEIYEEDIARVQNLIGRDLSHWLK